MFDNAGNKIRDYAKIVFWLSFINFIILAALAWHFFNFIAFIIIIMISFGFLYVESLFLSAFGELVESSSKTADSTKECSDKLQKLLDIYTQGPNNINHVEIRHAAPVISTESPIAPESPSVSIPSQPTPTVMPSANNSDVQSSNVKITKESQAYKLLYKSIQFSTDDGCRNHIKSNLDILNNEEMAFIKPIMQYLNSPGGIRLAVERLLKDI